MRLGRIWIAALVLALVAAACGGNDDAGSDDGTSSTTTTAAEGGTTTAAAPETTTTTTTQATTTTEPSETTSTQATPELDIPELDLGATTSIFEAAGVNSFRQRMIISISGELAEIQDLQGLGEIVMDAAYIQSPQAAQVEVTVAGETIGAITIGTDAWVQFGESEWIEAPGTDPADFTAGITDALPADELLQDAEDAVELVGEETLDGRVVDRYRLNEEAVAALAQEDPSVQIDEVSGDFWIDRETGLVVKFEATIDGRGFDDTNPDLQGRIEISYEVYDLGASFTIDPPV